MLESTDNDEEVEVMEERPAISMIKERHVFRLQLDAEATMLHSLNALVCATRQVVMIKTTGQFLEPIKVLSPPPRMVIVKLTPFAHKTPVRYSSNFTSIDFLLLVEMMVLSSSTGLKPLHSSIRI